MVDWSRIVGGLSDDGVRELLSAVSGVVGGGLAFTPFAGTQELAYFSSAERLLYGGRPNGGKDICKLQLVPVPLSVDVSGYKLHGDLVVGDYVYGSDGGIKRVLAVHDDIVGGDVYEVEFGGGEVVRCGGGHLWYVFDVDVGCYGVVSVMDMVGNFLLPGGGFRYCVDVVDPIMGVGIDLPCDPYLFGLWLCDGSADVTVGMLPGDFSDIGSYLPMYYSVYSLDLHGFELRGFRELRDVIMYCRHIPEVYLRGSYEQRLLLLRGMMDMRGDVDTDGYYVLCLGSLLLAEGVLDVVNSLGIRADMFVRGAGGFMDCYCIRFRTDEVMFRLSRKRARAVGMVGGDGCREIVDIRRVESVVTNCITVEGGLYCVGRSYIVTHNSYLLNGLALQEQHRSLLTRRNFSDLRSLINAGKSMVGVENFGGGDGSTGSRPYYDDGKRVIHYMGVANDDALMTIQGEAHEFLGIDEAAQMPERYVRGLMAWWRRTDLTPDDVRLRMVLATNPPLSGTNVGDWLIDWYRPWLDDRYHDPAASGEVRWQLPDGEGGFVECKEGDSTVIFGEEVFASSYSFIASSYRDNPYVNDAEFLKSLADMSPEDAKILMTGSFTIIGGDSSEQAIRGSDVKAAQDRWEGLKGGISSDNMVCAAIDPCGHGTSGDDAAYISLHEVGEYLVFSRPEVRKGISFVSWDSMAGWAMELTPKGVPIVVDMGGGYGEKVYYLLLDGGRLVEKFNGGDSAGAEMTSKYGFLFANMRAMSYLRLGEALDNGVKGGSLVALPSERRVFSELVAPKVEMRVIRGRQAKGLESKDKVKKVLGVSPDVGDAIAMCYWLYLRTNGGKRYIKRLKDNIKYHEDDYVGQKFIGNQKRKEMYFKRRPRRCMV